MKFDVHRVDNMVIQSIALLDQLDKDINLFGMRLREWSVCRIVKTQTKWFLEKCQMFPFLTKDAPLLDNKFKQFITLLLKPADISMISKISTFSEPPICG